MAYMRHSRNIRVYKTVNYSIYIRIDIAPINQEVIMLKLDHNYIFYVFCC